VRLRAAAASLSLLIAVSVGACGSGHVHVFGAFPYDALRDCLDVGQTLDVIDGPDPGSCSVLRCWLDPAGAAFVTDKSCDAPLNLTESTTGACIPALVAYKNHLMCPDLDGGADAS
jgi:hypothetical protein